MKEELDPIVQGMEKQTDGSGVHAVKLDYSTGIYLHVVATLIILIWKTIFVLTISQNVQLNGSIT